jgi:DNA polymerase III subunit delta'
VPILPLHGHETLRARLADLAGAGTLPSTILLQGPAGIGKQRFALWLGQLLLCEAASRPCGTCQHCRLALDLQHPDLRWFFPHEKIKGEDPSTEEVDERYLSDVAERREASGLYARPDGSMAIYKYTAKLLTGLVAKSPALAKRKVFVIGDAERMAPQAANHEMSNAVLKLLEEPAANTTFILTSSEPGALLPTIRSRTVAFRLSPVPDGAMRALLAEPAVAAAVPNEPPETLLAMAGGALGALIGGEGRRDAVARARLLLAAADGGRETMLKAALGAGSAKARGAFRDTLEALLVLLRERARAATNGGDAATAMRALRAIPAVEEAKTATEVNAIPQLLALDVMRAVAGDR